MRYEVVKVTGYGRGMFDESQGFHHFKFMAELHKWRLQRKPENRGSRVIGIGVRDKRAR